MTQCTSSGYQSSWLVEGGDSPRTIDTNSERWDFNSDSLRKSERLIIADGITGSRSMETSRRRRGPYSVAGSLVCDPSFAFFDAWLPRILGADESTDTFAVDEELPAWDVMSDRVGEIVRYNDCKVDKARLRFAPDKLTLTLECLGMEAIETGLSLPTVAFPTGIEYTPLGFMDCVFNIASGDRQITEGELLVDNGLTPHKFSGLDYAGCLREGQRLVTLTETSTSSAADWAALYGIAATTITITLAYLNMGGVITLSNCMAPIETPVVEGKGEIPMPLIWQAMGNTTTKEISWTNDPVNT
jgi:hypothetical protein